MSLKHDTILINITKDYFLVRIDKKAQDQKRSKLGSLYIPENFQDMVYNLQYGEVLDIGDRAAKKFPEVEIGDILIFHHHVEYKPRTDGDATYSDHHLVEVLPNLDELRTVDIAHEVFGVLKSDTQTIIPYSKLVFCHEEFQPASFQMNAAGIYIVEEWSTSVEGYTEQLDELQLQVQTLRSTAQFKINIEENYKEIEVVNKLISELNKERARISKKMNEEKYMELTLLYINKETSREWGIDMQPGDKIFAHSFALYPLDIDGVHFTLVNTDFIALIKNKDMKKFIPLHDRVLIRPNDSEKVTPGGLYVPDTALEKPTGGIVVAIGPGRKDDPVTLKEKADVLYTKHAGTDINILGEKLLLMREVDVIGFFEEAE